MPDRRCAVAMLAAARRDLLTLRNLTRDAPDESFGFHVQQAAEKALKAWIAALGERYPLTHSIRTLLDRLRTLPMDVTPFEELDAFTPYAVTFRYEGVAPGSIPIDRKAAIARLEALLARVEAAI